MKEIAEIHKSIGFFLGRTCQAMKNATTRRFAENGLDVASGQFGVLMALWYRDGISQSQIIKLTCKEKTTLARLVSKLEQKDLIRRESDPKDKRSKLIFLTEKGRALKDEVVPLARAEQNAAVKGLSDAEIDTLKKLLDKIYYNIISDEKEIESGR